MKQLAQEIEDGLTPEVFNAEVAKLTRLEGSTMLSESTKKRLSYLARIPFRAIVTTNYNNLLDGYPSVESPGGTATAISQGALNPQHNFERILRPVPGKRAIPSLLRWQFPAWINTFFTLHAAFNLYKTVTSCTSGREDNFSLDDLLSSVQEEKTGSSGSGAAFSSRESMEPETVADGWKLFEKSIILKVHGSVSDPSSIILSHGGYKRLLHETVGYKNFMLSLMATNTILYMGFSFNDE